MYASGGLTGDTVAFIAAVIVRLVIYVLSFKVKVCILPASALLVCFK